MFAPKTRTLYLAVAKPYLITFAYSVHRNRFTNATERPVKTFVAGVTAFYDIASRGLACIPASPIVVSANRPSQHQLNLSTRTPCRLNPLMGTLKPHSNGGARAGCNPAQSRLLTVPNVTAYPSTTSIPTSFEVTL